MEIRPLPAAEATARRFAETLWLPYHRELEDTVDAHALAEDADLVAEEVAFRLELLETESYRAWVAFDVEEAGEGEAGANGEGDVELADVADEDLAGFVTTDVEASQPVFDRPDRLVVGDVYVREPYRGTGLARDLFDRAADRAREAGCAEVALDVDVGNERAVAFYEKLGFETYRRRMSVAVDEL